MRQPRLVRLLIRFHFFFLMLPLRLLGQFCAVQKRSPRRVRAVLTLFESLIDGAFRFRHWLDHSRKTLLPRNTHDGDMAEIALGSCLWLLAKSEERTAESQQRFPQSLANM
jgi:hypothetical protein